MPPPPRTRRSGWPLWVVATVTALGLTLAASAPAAVPNGFVETEFASGMSVPTAMAFAPDGRLFVAEQTGRLRVIKNGTLLATPFLTVPVDSGGERGLLGVAFDPAFAANTAAGDVAVSGSERVIFDLDPVAM